MLKDLLAKPEVEHIRESLHRKFLSSSKFQGAISPFQGARCVFVDGLQIAAVSSLRQLPVQSEGAFFHNQILTLITSEGSPLPPVESGF